MKLSALAGETTIPDPDIAGLTADSRAVAPGFLFAALSGVNMDGARFIPDAEERGAAAVLARPGVGANVPIVFDAEPRRRLAQMSARFYPRQPEFIAGVTGTNGKTSTTVFARALWEMLGRRGGYLGTLGAGADGFERKVMHTTPEPVSLHRLLDEMAAAGVTNLAMEVSSHALDQHRADGVRFCAAAFTNITQDHLDYHADFDAYFRAKARLFSDLVAKDGAAVVNADGEGAPEIIALARSRGLKVLSTGAAGDDIRLTHIEARPDGLEMSVEADGAAYEIRMPLIGAFQAENALLAAGLVAASGFAIADILPLLARLPGVPGRMQHAANVSGAGVYVDYAHTPDAIGASLAAIRPHATARVIAIIGAGGDRDRKKRPLMGAAAAAAADIVIVTDDNPRTEDPGIIRRQVIAGCAGAIEIGDRAEAIARGVAMLRPGDVLLIAGKGHENGQIVGGETLPFDDVDVARQAVRNLKERGR
ncbi:MAG: UDP-N-acetylmuramoyl-L-alanyl-D-glutamate--2,6-diaminopimelate ligase [Parvularculaceae bacterium]|nr:UDP-N-acetylmuramoyl-L-alanyl-D-glutamate--2,6-diaminopimelate ligase [Parvularculaceae bacterium]